MIRSELRSLVNPLVLRNPARLALALDLMVPPLTLLVLLLASVMLLSVMLAASGLSSWPLVIATVNLALVFVATLGAWYVHGRKALPAATISRIPLYVLWKLRLYPRALLGANEGWVRLIATRTFREKAELRLPDDRRNQGTGGSKASPHICRRISARTIVCVLSIRHSTRSTPSEARTMSSSPR